jgi:RES domain-containing protein
MARHSRDEVACHLCFHDKRLQDWIKAQESPRGTCPWCGRRGHLVALAALGEPFRDVVDGLYVPVEGSDIYSSGDQIGFLLGDHWQVFAEKIEADDLAQELAVSILYAGLRPKARYDHPDYEGFFRRCGASLEETWDERAYAVLEGGLPPAGEAKQIGNEIATGLPDRMEVAFEDLATTYEPGKLLCRARLHKDRTRSERYGPEDLGAPPPNAATAGRANQKGHPVLYLASNKSTALAEVRPWKGAAVALAPAKIKRRLHLVDLSRTEPVSSPFFVELIRWSVELAGLLYRLGQDMSRPVMPHEEAVLYKPTQLLAWMIKSAGYDGCIYPSAMGPGTNVVLFNPDDVEMEEVGYFRVKQATYFSAPFSTYEAVYDEGPYDFAVSGD